MQRENSKPLIRQGWLRVLLFCIFYFILLVLSGRPLLLLVKKLRPEEKDPARLLAGEWLWLSVLLFLILSGLAVFIFRKFIDRKDIRSLGFGRAGYRDAAAGFFMAIAILGTGTLILYFSRHLQWTDITFNGSDLFIELVMMAMIAVYEEVVFRGYLLGNLMESFNKWIALLISAALFTIFHLDNPGINIIPVLNIFVAGILLGINYIYTRNLWFPILFHFAWNFFQGPILGYKVSGIILSPLLQTELNGDLLLTGGDFGFEGSIFDLGLTLICVLLLYYNAERHYNAERLTRNAERPKK